LLTVGASGPPYGGYVCMDVGGDSLTVGETIQAWDCHGSGNQQYQLIGVPNGSTIYALAGQRCVDVQGAGTTPGTKVWSYSCNGTVAQVWNYIDGTLRNPNSGLCLDAGNMANGTQLIINTCNGAASQNWQIK